MYRPHGAVYMVRELTNAPPPNRMTRAQAADYLGLSEATLAADAVTRRHRIPFAKVGRRCIYTRELLDQWLAKRTVNAPSTSV